MDVTQHPELTEHISKQCCFCCTHTLLSLFSPLPMQIYRAHYMSQSLADSVRLHQLASLHIHVHSL